MLFSLGATHSHRLLARSKTSRHIQSATEGSWLRVSNSNVFNIQNGLLVAFTAPRKRRRYHTKLKVPRASRAGLMSRKGHHSLLCTVVKWDWKASFLHLSISRIALQAVVRQRGRHTGNVPVVSHPDLGVNRSLNRVSFQTGKLQTVNKRWSIVPCKLKLYNGCFRDSSGMMSLMTSRSERKCSESSSFYF